MTTLRKTLFSVRAGSSSSSADRGKEISPQHVGSIPEDDFRGKGVELNVKYFGRCEVSEPRGERVAHAAMKELKQQLQASSGHKQRVVVNLSMFGVQLFDEKRLKELAKHSVKAISFMTIDPDDTKTFSYIAAEGPDEQNPKRIFRLYCFKSEKQTVLITKSMMRIFKLAHEEKKKQQSGDEGGKPIVRRGTTRNSPLPPLPTPAQGNESQYASLSSNVSPTPAKLQQGGRGSLALIELNNAEAAAVAAAQNANLASGEPPNSNYAAVNPGLKATFSMVPFGLPLSRVDDVTAMPAPIGAPYVDVAPDPFSDMEQPGAPPHPVQARGSTIMAFDPVGFGGEKGTAAPDGFGSDFGGFSDSFTPQSAEEQPGSDVYAVPRFPPIRAVLSDEDDPARDSGSLFPSTTPTS